jgi:hypothetical protein
LGWLGSLVFCETGAPAAHLVEDPGSLTNLNQVPVGVTQVAADLQPVILGLSEELTAAGAPLVINGVDVGHPDVQRAA